MLKSSWGVLSLILCAVFAISPMAAAADTGSEVFVVSSSHNGDANFLSLTDRDPAVSQEILQETVNTVIGEEVSYLYSEGNGLGDFDNDGDLDYIMAIGFWFGNIYISEKLNDDEIVDGKRFAQPSLVANWGMDGGFYSMDFAVADYDGDDNVDFVLSLDYSTGCALYLGDGAFGFEYKPLPETAASDSTGADAADFNNDGHADFVIAPGSEEPFYVNLGHGDGNFTTVTFDSIDGGSVSGVAAADFTGDGITDIVAVYQNKLYVYQGALVKGEWDIVENDVEGDLVIEWVNVVSGGSVDGVSFTYLDLQTNQLPLPINISGLDNLDFDGDGHQDDLVVASYGADTSGVAVLLGNGDGTFSHFATHLGGFGNELNAVTAQPWEPAQNVAPVAVIEPADIGGTAGVAIVFDGSASTDEDGEIVSYAWDFGDASPEATGVNPSHTYPQSGTYVVTLRVADDQDAEASVQAQVVVVEPEPVVLPPEKEVPDDGEQIATKVKFYPRKLYLKRKKGRDIRAKIRFAEGFDARNVDRSSVYILADDGTKIWARGKKGRGFFDKLNRYHHKPRKSISVRFDRQEVVEALGDPAAKKATLTVHGKISDGDQTKDFEAAGVLRLKMKKRGQCRPH